MAQVGTAGKTDHVLDAFLRGISSVRGEIVELYLYGSRSRGDHHPDSDYDVFVVLHERTRDTIDTLYDAVVEVVCESGSLSHSGRVEALAFRRSLQEACGTL